jgi:hypothetical protein
MDSRALIKVIKYIAHEIEEAREREKEREKI